MVQANWLRLLPVLVLLAVGVCHADTGDSTTARICALYPHLKDSYWLSINAGMVDAAKEAEVELKVMEAGGYANEALQIRQYMDCLSWPADVILLGSVSYNLSPTIIAGTKQVTTLGLVNQVEPGLLATTIGVSWLEKGRQLAAFINQRYPTGGQLPTLLMLGPEGSGGSQFVQQGLLEELEPDTLFITEILHGQNSVARQRNLLRRYLSEHEPPSLIVGGAVAIEVAVSELANLGMTQQTDLISTYLSHGVYRALMREQVVMANSDQMRTQGQLAVQTALSWLRGDAVPQQVAPSITTLTPPLDIGTFKQSLSDPGFRPVYHWPHNL